MKLKLIIAAMSLVAGSAIAGPVTSVAVSHVDGWSVLNNVNVAGGNAMMTAGNADVFASISKVFAMNAGDIFRGVAKFQAQDYSPYNDYSIVKMNGVTLFAADVSTVGNYGVTAPTAFEFKALTKGNYTFFAGVANKFDSANSSQLTVSNLALEAKVPEPGSLALLGLGLIGFAVARRKAA